MRRGEEKEGAERRREGRWGRGEREGLEGRGEKGFTYVATVDTF